MKRHWDYFWKPWEIPRELTDSDHDMAEKWLFWVNSSDPLLIKLRAAGYLSACYMTYRSMKSTPWVCVEEDIDNPNDLPWPLFWEIGRHSGLAIGGANGYDMQLRRWSDIYKEGLDDRHGEWYNKKCRVCFPEEGK